MPVYDFGYRTLEAGRRGGAPRWLAIPKFAYMDFVANRIYLFLFLFALAPMLIGLGNIYLLINTDLVDAIGAAGFLPPIEERFFKNAIDRQLLGCFLMALVLGAGIISKDLKHHAIAIVYSKPIRKWEYFLGKFSVIFSMTMLLTWGVAMLLFALEFFFGAESYIWRGDFFGRSAPLLLDVTLYSLVIAVSLSLLVMTASCLTRGPLYASMAFAGFVLGAHIFAGALALIMDASGWWVFSPLVVGEEIGEAIFGFKTDERIAPAAAWGAILGGWAVCGAILQFRLARAARYGG